MTRQRLGFCGKAWWVSMAVAAALVGPSVSDAVAANPVTDWNTFSTELFTLQPSGLVDTRIYAIQHAAIHDALNTIRPRYQRYTACGGVDGHARASVAAAVAQASRDVLAELWATNAWANPPLAPPTMQATVQGMIEARYVAALSGIPENEAKARGRAIGGACARANLDKRADDGLGEAGAPFSPTPIYIPGTAPGDYQLTPPFDAPPVGPLAVGPGWGNMTPFAFDLSKHDVPGPLPLSSRLYAADFNFVKAIGGTGSEVRTAEQSAIADFWYESSGSGWNRIANIVITQRAADVWQAARILALVNFALVDGYIAGFDAKYRFNFWRPITAIHMAAFDGNALTAPDPGWSPYCVTPPVPDQPSTHTVLGAAAAEVLIQNFGDRVRFSTTSASLPNVTRHYRGFTDPAIENGLSRIYCGIHFVKAVRDGYDLGRAVGRQVHRELPALRGNSRHP